MTNPRLKNDIILITLLVLIPLGMLVFSNISSNSTDNLIVKITVDGKHYKTIDLEENTKVDVISESGFNHIVINNGKVWVSDTDCPDKICKNHNPISKNGEQIVCLPHRVVVEIVSYSEKEIDSLSR